MRHPKIPCLRLKLSVLLDKFPTRLHIAFVLSLLGSCSTLSFADTPPPHWIRYATLASQQLEDRLSNTEETQVTQLQGWLRKSQDLHRSIVVSIWISANGQVSKLEFAPLTQASINQALHELLSSTEFTEPPPPDMPQPLRLQLGLGLRN